MSQLDNVLRRSIAHIDPADWQGRDRVFASAREAMIRLLRVYDPPLSAEDIDRKIKEFDDVIDAIEVEYRWARPLGDTLALAPPRRPAAPVLAALSPPEEEEADEEDEGAAVVAGEADELYADDPDDEDYDDYEDYDGDDYPYDGDDEPRGGLFGLIDRIGWRIGAARDGTPVRKDDCVLARNAGRHRHGCARITLRTAASGLTRCRASRDRDSRGAASA